MMSVFCGGVRLKISYQFFCYSYLFVTANDIFILRETTSEPGMALIMARRPLGRLVQITSKKRHPKLMSFKYGGMDAMSGEINISDIDRMFIPEAEEATTVIVQLCKKGRSTGQLVMW